MYQAVIWRSCLALWLCSAAAFAETVYQGQAKAPFCASPFRFDATEVTLEFNLPKVDVDASHLPEFGKGATVNVDYPHLRFATPGCPDVPGLTCMVQIPDSGALEVVLDRYESRTLENVTLSPRQYPVSIGCDFQAPYTLNRAVYGKDAYYPSAIVSPAHCDILRELRVATITFNPVRYNPIAKKLELITKAYVTVKVRPGERGNNELRLADRALTPSFLPMYDEVVNFDRSRLGQVRTAPACYLFMGSQANLDAVKDLIQWKKQKGYTVKTAVPGQDGLPTTVEGIHQWIQEAYKTWDPKPEYILLVGNEGAIPSKMGESCAPGMIHKFASDNAYAVMGEGILPSISIGRITGNRQAKVDDPAVLSYVAGKILKHDKEPPEGDFNSKVLAYGCHSKGSGDGIGLKIQKEWLGYIGNQMTVIKGTDKASSAGGAVMNTATFCKHINDGVALVTYVGHGNQNKLGNVKFETSHADALQNSAKQPIILSLACLAGDWSNGYCLYEHLMDQGTPESPKGAVAVYGHSTFGNDGVNGIISNALKNVFQKKLYKIGPVLVNAKQFNLADPDVESGTIFGCPEIDIITGALKAFKVECPSVKEGACAVQVSVDGTPFENAMVGVSNSEGETLGGGYTDASGAANLTLKNVPSASEVYVTVTGHNCKPEIIKLKAE